MLFNCLTQFNPKTGKLHLDFFAYKKEAEQAYQAQKQAKPDTQVKLETLYAPKTQKPLRWICYCAIIGVQEHDFGYCYGFNEKDMKKQAQDSIALLEDDPDLGARGKITNNVKDPNIDMLYASWNKKDQPLWRLAMGKTIIN